MDERRLLPLGCPGRVQRRCIARSPRLYTSAHISPGATRKGASFANPAKLQMHTTVSKRALHVAMLELRFSVNKNALNKAWWRYKNSHKAGAYQHRQALVRRQRRLLRGQTCLARGSHAALQPHARRQSMARKHVIPESADLSC